MNTLDPTTLGCLFVTFSSNDNGLVLPDPRLLPLHATCVRVAHLSGAAEAFNKVERDLEDAIVLAFDGSSAHLLDHLLAPLRPFLRMYDVLSFGPWSPRVLSIL